MPEVQFEWVQRVLESMEGTLDVPQEVIDQGEEAMIRYAQEHLDEMDLGWHSFIEVTEDFLDLEVRSLLEEK